MGSLRDVMDARQTTFSDEQVCRSVHSFSDRYGFSFLLFADCSNDAASVAWISIHPQHGHNPSRYQGSQYHADRVGRMQNRFEFDA